MTKNIKADITTLEIELEALKNVLPAQGETSCKLTIGNGRRVISLSPTSDFLMRQRNVGDVQYSQKF